MWLPPQTPLTVNEAVGRVIDQHQNKACGSKAERVKVITGKVFAFLTLNIHMHPHTVTHLCAPLDGLARCRKRRFEGSQIGSYVSLACTETLLQLSRVYSSRLIPDSPLHLALPSSGCKEAITRPSVLVWSPESPGSRKSSLGKFLELSGYPEHAITWKRACLSCNIKTLCWPLSAC